MKSKNRSILQIVEDQARQWEKMHLEKTTGKKNPTITISREPGSGGKLVAAELASSMGLDLFHQEVVHEMAESANVSKTLLETLDEKGVSTLEDSISSAIYKHYLWPDEYLKHLMKIIGTIGKHGRAVIVGRGANFILGQSKCFRVRIIAPRDLRVENVCKEFGTPKEETRRRVIKTESERKAFIRKYFNADITDPNGYDLILNTAKLNIAACVDIIRASIKQ